MKKDELTNVKRVNKKNHKNRRLLGCFVSCLISTSAFSEEIWKEDFNDPTIDGKGAVFNVVDMENVTKWSVNVSSAGLTATSDWFKVNNQQFQGRDLDGVAFWQSEVISIVNFEQITLAIAASETGNHEPTDFLSVEYSIDGDTFTLVPNWQGKGSSDYTLIDDFETQQITTEIAEGSSLVVRISMKNNAGSEYINFDEVIVSGQAKSDGEIPPDDGTPPEDETTISNACYNCPDLTKVASSNDFNDAIYYANAIEAINAGQSVAEIKTIISAITATNHQVLSYSEVWTALTQTDEDPTNSDNVILIYKGNSIAKFSNGSGSQSSNPDNWNREHVWAKSHGFPSSSASAYTDIHHLRPADISVNSARGNLDFDFSDSELAEAPENKVDSDSFEPRAQVKGDIARMTFYMDVRYQGDDSQTPNLNLVNTLTSVGEAKLGKLCALLAWHEADPVDEYERNRNNKIYEFQGNRNPFIDHPEWVEKIFDLDCSSETDPVDPVDPVDPIPSGAGLFFSEYVEGSSYNKAIEIFNPTDATISLAGWAFNQYSNGSTEPTATLSLTGEIASQDVLVIGSSQITADSALKAYVDVFSSAINFNGDDYIELTLDGNVVDSFGTKGVRQSWAANVTLVRLPTISTGDTITNDEFDKSIEWQSHASNSFSYLGSHEFNGVSDEPELELGMCKDPATFISNVQGSDIASPLIGQRLIVEAVVTAIANDLSGFFIQEEVSDNDDDSQTSEAIFVDLNSQGDMPAVDQLVRVLGDVKEFYNRTQLSLSQPYLDCGAATAIEASELTLPVNSFNDFEALEGMLVTNRQSLKVTDHYNLGKYGEFAVASSRLIKPTNLFAPNSANAIALIDSNARNILYVDDMSNEKNSNEVPFPTGSLAYNNTLRLGDSVSQLTGILDYSYQKFRVRPSTAPVFSSTNARQTAPNYSTESDLRVASFNVLNYFNGDGQGAGFPTSRGASSYEEFVRQNDKIVNAIAEINADIIGLMEIENDGFGELSAIAELTSNLNNVMGAGTYQYVSLDADRIGGDKVTVGMLYKPSKVATVNNGATTEQVPFDYGNRPPLVQSFKAVADDTVFTVAVNHLKAKAGCSSATGNNVDLGDGQGCWNELRTQAATAFLSWLSTNPTNVDQSNIIVIGDMNSYAKEDPISVFISNQYQDLLAKHQGVNAYTYSYAGEVGSLDHALATPAMAAMVDDAQVWHINADEPHVFDYNIESKSSEQLSKYYGADAFRASDHDPVVISFSLPKAQALIGDFDGDQDIDRSDITLFTQRLRAGEQFGLEYDFNFDGMVNLYDARALMAKCTRSRCAI